MADDLDAMLDESSDSDTDYGSDVGSGDEAPPRPPEGPRPKPQEDGLDLQEDIAALARNPVVRPFPGRFLPDELLHRVARKAPPPWPEDAAVECMLVDAVETTNLWGARIEETTLRLFCCAAEGFRVVVDVRGFRPFFYLRLREGVAGNDECARLLAELRQGIATNVERKYAYSFKLAACRGQELFGYQGDREDIFVKVSATNRACLSKVHTTAKFMGYESFEYNISPEQCLLKEVGLGGAGWLRVAAGDYRVLSRTAAKLRVSAHYRVLKPLAAVDQIPPLVVANFDIECVNNDFQFPQADKDPVVQIAVVVNVHGADLVPPGYRPPARKSRIGTPPQDQERDRLVQVLFSLKGCVAFPEEDCVEVLCYGDERDLLLSFVDFVRAVDADVITGYNTNAFDWPYLFDRAKTLGIHKEFSRLSRVAHRKAFYDNREFRGANFSTLRIPGRCLPDVIREVRENLKLESYTLNHVASKVLGVTKLDLSYFHIPGLYNTSKVTRTLLGQYCMKDARLSMLLWYRKDMLTNIVSMSRVTGVIMNTLVTRGQQIRVLTQIQRFAAVHDTLVPTRGGPSSALKGATVLTPQTGFYPDHVAVLDFKSLYPSIIISYNLCYSTWIPRGDLPNHDPSTYHVSPAGHAFVNKSVREGLVPKLLQVLLDSRKDCRERMKRLDKNSEEYRVLNARQKAFKVGANSVYGFTASGTGQLACMEVAESVTAYGRKLIEETAGKVKSVFGPGCEEDMNANVIYGDTDSVMVHLPGNDHERAIARATRIAERCNEDYEGCIELEFEKVYSPYLLLTKKRYAGCIVDTKGGRELDYKGVAITRRDYCVFVRNVMRAILNEGVLRNNPSGAMDVYVSLMERMNEAPREQFINSKSFKNPEEYKSEQAHVVLAKRMAKDKHEYTPRPGDRIQFLIEKRKGKNLKLRDQIVTPREAFTRNITLDSERYAKIARKRCNDVLKLLCPDRPIPPINLPTNMRIIQSSNEHRNYGLYAFLKEPPVCVSCRSRMDNPLEPAAPQEVPELYESSTDDEDEPLARLHDVKWRLELEDENKPLSCIPPKAVSPPPPRPTPALQPVRKGKNQTLLEMFARQAAKTEGPVVAAVVLAEPEDLPLAPPLRTPALPPAPPLRLGTAPRPKEPTGTGEPNASCLKRPPAAEISPRVPPLIRKRRRGPAVAKRPAKRPKLASAAPLNVLCDDCLPDIEDVHIKLSSEYESAAEKARQAVAKCMACAGSQYVNCSAYSCPDLYVREETKHAAQAAKRRIEQLKECMSAQMAEVVGT